MNPTIKICGNCLHSKEAHNEYNGIGMHMYCSSCHKLCPTSEFNYVHNHDKQILIGAKMLE